MQYITKKRRKQMQTFIKIKLALAVISIILVGACAQTSVTPTSQPAVAPKNHIESITGLEAEIAAGKKNELDVLSPDWFSKAEEFYAKAKKSAEEGSEISGILEYTAKAQGALESAKETAKVARTMLPEVIESRNKAHLAGAATLGKDFTSVEEQFLDLTRAIEDNNIRYTQKNAPNVSEAYLALELSAIKADSIEKVHPLLAQAKDEKAEKYVPQSFSMAQKSVDDTDKFITDNRYAKEAIDQKVKESMFQAQRTLALNNQSKTLEKMKPEEIALLMEKSLHQITTQLSAQDMRNQAMNTQVDTIIESITQLQNDNRSLNVALDSEKKAYQERSALYESQVTALNQRIATLEGTTVKDQKVKAELLAEQKAAEQKLAAEREFNKKYLEVQTLFRANEAEVYKQRNQLVIRLKAMQFPVGTATISPENFALLGKVQRAIQTFEGSSVVVEGHTDSTGSDEINQALSTQRAEAVSAYLVANKTIPADKIDSRGYGPTRPLASNTTPEGRAINRRIDVIINPSLTPGQ
jgi:OOP family OmpA-OmpF porin